MTLSTFLAKGLQEAEMGVNKLYGGGYFTEEEWVILDGLLHKGKYVFTSGPPNPPAEERSFGDSFNKSTGEISNWASEVTKEVTKEVIKESEHQSPSTQIIPSQFHQVTPIVKLPVAKSTRSTSQGHFSASTLPAKAKPCKLIGKYFTALESYSPAKAQDTKLVVARGDRIKVVNHVSGYQYSGQNMRTGKLGQIHIALIVKGAVVTGKKADGFSMDEVERRATANWEDDDDDTIEPSTKPKGSSNSGQVRQAVGTSLGGSRFAILADIDHQSFNESTESDSTLSSHKGGPNKNSKTTESSLNDSNNSSLNLENTMPRLNTAQRLRSKPYGIVVPKTEVCYYWDTGNRCRYTEAQCRDLHEDREYTLQTNLRNGKPNPGPLFDVVHPIPSPPPGKSHEPPLDPSTTVGKRFTCFFWHRGKCNVSESKCMYLHTYVGSEGILREEVQNQAYRNKKKKLIGKPKYENADKDWAADGWGSS